LCLLPGLGHSIEILIGGLIFYSEHHSVAAWASVTLDASLAQVDVAYVMVST